MAVQTGLQGIGERREGRVIAASGSDGGTPSHAVLVERIGNGDRAAEHEFVACFLSGIRALVRRQARPADPVVEDLVQSIVQNILVQLRQRALKDPVALPGYVRNTVMFTVRAEYRRRKRQGGDSLETFDTLVDPEDPERKAQREQLAKLVHRLLSELSVDRDRQILKLHYLAEEDRDTICRTLDIDVDHFHRVLFRARSRLKELLLAAGFDGSETNGTEHAPIAPRGPERLMRPSL